MDKKEARRNSRIVAVETLFSYLERKGKISPDDSLTHVLSLEEKSSDDLAGKLLNVVIENLAKLKLVIKAFAPDFPFHKIAPINRAVLLLGLAEMKYIGTPPVVVINEYIEIAKIFGEQKSGGFINAVLDSFRKNAKFDENLNSDEN